MTSCEKNKKKLLTLFKDDKSIDILTYKDLDETNTPKSNLYSNHSIIILVDQSSIELIIKLIGKLVEKDIGLLFITSNIKKTEARLVIEPNIEILNKELKVTYLLIKKSKKYFPYSSLSGIIFETSGTTGNPKFVYQTRLSLLNTAKDIIKTCNLNSNVKELVYSPRSSAFFVVRVIVVILLKGQLFLPENNNFITNISVLSKDYVNSFSADTPIWEILLKHNINIIKDLKERLLWAKLSSANPSPESKMKLKELLPETTIVLGYGLSEYMRATFQLINSPLKDEIINFDSVGKVSLNTEIKILNREDNCNIEGEILIKGAHLAKTYLFNDALWNSRIKNNYFCTGDIGFFNNENELLVIGRKDNIIQIGGKSYCPEWLEKKWLVESGWDKRKYAILITKSNNQLGAKIIIFILKHSEKDISKKIISEFASFFKFPKQIIMTIFIKNIPMTNNGKINRKVLKDYIEL